VALPLDTSRPVRSRADQQALVRAVYEAPAGEQETDFAEWKGPLELSGKNASGRAAIAKAVLGFGNRNPDLALRNMCGCAYFLAGVSPGEIRGVEVVDAAQLESQVASFVGPNISWRADYVELDGHDVLVVSVEPPQWGDPVHPARKTYNPEGGGRSALQEGTIYVRHQASTERATAADMDMLSRRAARRPGDELEVAVQVADTTRLRAVDISEEAIAAYVAGQKSWLLRPFSPLGRKLGMSGSVAKALAMGVGEYRSEERYRHDVHEYVEELRGALPSALRAKAILHETARLDLEVMNATDTTFTDVRIELLLPSHFEVWEWRDQARGRATPPSAPALYGRGAGQTMPLVRLPYERAEAIVPFRAPDVEPRGAGIHVVFSPTNVRAQGVTELWSLWLIVDDPATEAIAIQWEATATNAAKRLTGKLTVPVAGPPAEIRELLSELPEED
jgi:hypothetical protein